MNLGTGCKIVSLRFRVFSSMMFCLSVQIEKVEHCSKTFCLIVMSDRFLFAWTFFRIDMSVFVLQFAWVLIVALY
jgi:hypothetical protein